MAENPILEAAAVYREARNQVAEARALAVDLGARLREAEDLECRACEHASKCRVALLELAAVNNG